MTGVERVIQAGDVQNETLRDRLFRPGETVWRRTHSDHASFLIDADAFYTRLAQALLRAEEQVFILGWDTDSRTELPKPDGLPRRFLTDDGRLELGTYLSRLAAARPNLRIYILSWDFAFIYLFEREPLPSLQFGRLESDRIRFVLDHQHPALASHHQKIVVVDDEIAFCGGLDITQRRWDTPEHKGEDLRRVDPGGHKYGPFHDVQIAVSGQTARALGDIARERWKLATGQVIEPSSSRNPEAARVAEGSFQDAEFAVARTLPLGRLAANPIDPVNEVEKLFLAMIKEARRFIYIENQYFTSPIIAHALAERLRDADGPEIVMILPRDQTGWIEESTMGLLRSQALKTVREADHYGRFRAYYPVVPALGEGYVKVHSKVMVIDDEIGRVGSANLNNRSMGVDTECDLAFCAGDRADLKAALKNFRASLISEHLDVKPTEFEARFAELGSFVKAVESFIGGPRTLVTMEDHIPDWVVSVAPPTEWIDPVKPNGFLCWYERMVKRYPAVPVLLKICLVALGVAAVFLVIKNFEALRKSLRFLRHANARDVAREVRTVRDALGASWAAALPLTIVAFALASLIFIPLTVLIVGIGFTFSLVPALTVSCGGAVLASLIGYGLGRYWAYAKSDFLKKSWVAVASERLRQGGLSGVTLIRLIPIAPFTVVNFVAGGLRLPVHTFLLGTLIGLSPGIVVLTLASQMAEGAAEQVARGGVFELAKSSRPLWWSLVTAFVLIASLSLVHLKSQYKLLRQRKRA